MAWSTKYKKSIDCNNPKGFSQKAHCAGRKARQKGEKTKSKSVREMKQNINEGPFGAAKKLSDAFFDGLKKNQTDRILSKARKARLDKEAIEKMEKIAREKKELEQILASIPKAK